MKVEFAKIGHAPKPFHAEFDGIKLDCNLKKIYNDQVELDGRMQGTLADHCDRCGKEYNIKISNDLKLKLSDTVVSDKADLDIIEFLNGVIDMDYILESEINAIKSFYHYCERCADNDEEFLLEI